MRATLFLIISVLLLTPKSNATTRRVLFIGNSYTYTNSMPTMLQSFAAACGDTLIFDMSAPGGYTFQQHTTDATTLAKIVAQPWDIVILQEQSQMPSFPPAQVETDVYPFARKLDSLIHDHDTCTQTMFMMTWGRKNGDAMNCASYPVVCTYAGMQGRLRESYMQMTTDNNAIVAPVGSAWKIVVDSFPTIDLYIADESHPSVPGSYLEACVLYNSIFHKKAKGCSYTSGLSASVVQTLQRLADKVVLDSMNTWQQFGHYPYANFSSVVAGSTVSLTNASKHANGYYWTFGNGHTDTAASPTYSYLTPGTYVITLTAKNNCFSETPKDTVHVGTASIEVLTNGNPPVEVRYNGYGNVSFMIPGKVYSMLDIYNSQGQLLVKRELDGSTLTEQLPTGFYIFKAYAIGGSAVYYGKITP